MANSRVGGTFYVRVDGTQLKTKGSFEVPLLKNKREAVTADDGDTFYSEKKETPYVKGTVIITPDFPLSALSDSDDMTVTVELANGMTYVLSGAWLASSSGLKVEDGTAELEFNGTSGGFQ